MARSRGGGLGSVSVGELLSSVTDRDLEILRLLYRHRLLTTCQLTLLFFRNRNTAQHRLSRLYRLGLVDRVPLPGPGGRPGEYGYLLDALGARLLPEGRPRGWRTEWARRVATSRRLAHQLGVNELFVRLAAAAHELPDAGLVEWWGEPYCRRRLADTVRPDGFGVWRQRGLEFGFFLEYDRGSEPLARLAGKLPGYARVEAELGWSFWLLVVLPGPRREHAARAALSGPGLPVATTSHPAADRPADAVWTPLGAEHVRLTLAGLAGWPRPEPSVARLAAAQDESWRPPADWWRRPSALPNPGLPTPGGGAFMDRPAERGA